MTRPKITLADMRLRLITRMAVADKSLFKTLWAPKSHPHERDAARSLLVAFITQGWDSWDIDVTGNDPAPNIGADCRPRPPEPS